MSDVREEQGSRVSAAAGTWMGVFTSPFRSKLARIAMLGLLAGGGRVAYGAVADAGTPEWAMHAIRISGSFLVAFFFAYFIRRAIILALVLAGLLAAAIYGAKQLGLGPSGDDADALLRQVQESAATIQRETETVWKRVEVYLPSGASAGFGFFRGWRRAKAPLSA